MNNPVFLRLAMEIIRYAVLIFDFCVFLFIVVLNKEKKPLDWILIIGAIIATGLVYLWMNNGLSLPWI
jgi:hypothetical protein